MNTLDLKFDDGSVEVKQGVITGYASVFGIQDQGGDKVMPGAYTKSLITAKAQSRKIKMLWQHDPSAPIGVWEEVKEDEYGLLVKGRLLPEVAQAKEAIALLEAGAIDGLSIGYRTRKATKGEDGSRELQDLDLWEVSLVTFPMQIEAGISDIKSIESVAEQKREIEEGLRATFGFSTREAKHGASLLVSEVLGRDDTEAVAGVAEDMKQFLRGLGA